MKSYIDIHTHANRLEDDVLSVHSLYRQYEGAAATSVCSIGIHPWYIDADNLNSQFLVLKQFAGLDTVIAIGECGLDKLTKTDWGLQLRAFKMQIELANITNKPLVIHCVRAYEEVLKMLKESQVTVPVIFHGFNKKWQLVEQILKAGYCLSFGAALLNDNVIIHEVLVNTPVEKLFLETDDTGADIKDIYRAAALIRKTPLDTLILQLQKNFETVFKR